MIRDMSPEEREARRAYLEDLLGDMPPEAFGPVPRPERFVHLPPHVRDWLGGKSKAELERLDKMLADYTAAQTIGRFGKWLAILVSGVFVTSWAMAQAGIGWFGFFKGGGR